jgi:hypothetical protein
VKERTTFEIINIINDRLISIELIFREIKDLKEELYLKLEKE